VISSELENELVVAAAPETPEVICSEFEVAATAKTCDDMLRLCT
jgi:hypothetical protein